MLTIFRSQWHAHRGMCLCRVTRWDTWELQLTFTFVKILFWLSSFPFLLFTLGGETLFTHTDPTAYNAHGRIVSPQTTGLSAYLSWLRDDILNNESYQQVRMSSLCLAAARVVQSVSERDIARYSEI